VDREERSGVKTGERASARPTVLAIIGSMRKLGNCELFAKAVSQGIPFEHDLRLVRLPALNILPCTGCYRCLNDGSCRIEDDIPFLIDQIAAADALIIASPVYFLGTHASIKALLDRAFGFFSSLEKIAGTPCVLVNVHGMRDRIGVAPQALLTLASFLGLEAKASVNLQAALPGEWLANKSRKEMAARLGRLLFSEKGGQKGTRACPFCGSDIVRMRKTDFLCTLCHGSFCLDERGRAVKGQPGWNVGSVEFVRSHREWLKDMKGRFLATRKRLLALSLPYKDTGVWVEPASRPVGEKGGEKGGEV
jgi:multimeric flavodoxin WrbA